MSSLACSRRPGNPHICGRLVRRAGGPQDSLLASEVGVVSRRTLPLTCGVRPHSGELASELNRITGHPAGVGELVSGPRGRRLGHRPIPWESPSSGTSMTTLGPGGAQCRWDTQNRGRGSAFPRRAPSRSQPSGGFVGSEGRAARAPDRKALRGGCPGPPGWSRGGGSCRNWSG